MKNLLKVIVKIWIRISQEGKFFSRQLLYVTIFTLYTPALLLAQTVVVDTITRPNFDPGTLAVYEAGNKLFVGDWETGNLLIYDGTSLDLLAELPIEGGCGGSCMVVHEASGKLYLVTFPYGRHIAVVNAITNELIGYIEIDGGCLRIDQELGRVYTIRRYAPFVLYAIDVYTHNVNSVTLSNSGLTSGLGINPVTHEVFIGYLQGNSLDIVDGITMTLTTVPGINGRSIIVNWLENKVYGTLGTYNGFWVYDRDIDSVGVITTGNDAAVEFFNSTTNRVHTSSEVNRITTIIEGVDDSWFNISMYSATVELGVRYATNHVYYVGFYHIVVLDGSTLEWLVDILSPWLESRKGQDIAINQSTGRVFMRFSSYSEDGIVLVIQDSPIVGIEEDTRHLDIPNTYYLSQNYPNPFNPSTRISYSLPNSGFITLKVYDVLGRKIQILVNEFQKAGNYSVNFEASELPSGIYFYKLQAGSFVETKKMVLMK